MWCRATLVRVMVFSDKLGQDYFCKTHAIGENNIGGTIEPLPLFNTNKVAGWSDYQVY